MNTRSSYNVNSQYIIRNIPRHPKVYPKLLILKDSTKKSIEDSLNKWFQEDWKSSRIKKLNYIFFHAG